MDDLPLTAQECRVLGSLVEKAATTPDQYPLSSNGLRTACNQRTARDPVVAYDERLVDATVLSLRDKGLARTIRGAGQRVFKHKHTVDEAWALDPGQLAVLAVLMLRGPQTAGELRIRTERAHGFADTSDVEGVLDGLARRDPPLVRVLIRQPGQKDVRYLTTAAPPQSSPRPDPPVTRREPDGRGVPDGPPVAVRGDASELARLRDEVAGLRRTVDRICSELGISVDEPEG